MTDSTAEIRIVPLPQSQDILSDLLRQGAQRLLAQAIEAEVTGWIETHAQHLDGRGHRQGVWLVAKESLVQPWSFRALV